MSNHIHFKNQAMVFSSYGGEPQERAAICRLVGTKESETIGAGIAFFDGASIPWTVLYDEVIVVLEYRLFESCRMVVCTLVRNAVE